MCGIAGYVARSPLAEPDSVLARMAASIRHRGPDAEGFFRDSYAALAHRRLSIIDLATGRQPMANESGALHIVYNGEVFNHAGLRPELEAAGHRYCSRSDTETILHCYEQYGPAALEKFRGMFAFAIWDADSRTLFCARDRLGIKPFYYFWDGRIFVFASEIKALFEHPAVSPEFDDSLLSEYLAFGYISGERTLFKGVRKLMPGHCLTLTPGAFRIERYWDVPQHAEPENRDDESWIRECRQRLEETVRMRLMSDVPLGMFLSGGVDSGAIASLMRRMTSGPVKTFAVGYREAAFSELDYARQTASFVGTEHHEVVIGMDEFFDALPSLVWHEDEPIVWPSSVSLYFVSRLASEHVKVVLTGEGSDEMFAGYSRYRFYDWNARWLRFYRAVPAPLRRFIRARVEDSRLLSGSVRRKLQHSFVGRGEDLQSLYLDNFYSAFSASEQSRLLRRPGSLDAYDSYFAAWDAAASLPLISRLLYADQKTYLVELLMKQDQMSMACSIESRVPFLDHPFVEFAARVPAHLKIRGRESKYILKRAVEDLLPRETIYRKKMGFPTPVRDWFASARSKPLIDSLCDKNGFISAYIDTSALDSLLDRHRSGAVDATDRIWRLLNLQIWGDLYFTGRRPRAAAAGSRCS